MYSAILYEPVHPLPYEHNEFSLYYIKSISLRPHTNSLIHSRKMSQIVGVIYKNEFHFSRDPLQTLSASGPVKQGWGFEFYGGASKAEILSTRTL